MTAVATPQPGLDRPALVYQAPGGPWAAQPLAGATPAAQAASCCAYLRLLANVLPAGTAGTWTVVPAEPEETHQ